LRVDIAGSCPTTVRSVAGDVDKTAFFLTRWAFAWWSIISEDVATLIAFPRVFHCVLLLHFFLGIEKFLHPKLSIFYQFSDKSSKYAWG